MSINLYHLLTITPGEKIEITQKGIFASSGRRKKQRGIFKGFGGL